jgi:23S rRNA (adenine2030-N6)-methyltransferase
MNYRHIFHAGNICDTVKHIVLTLAIAHLRSKDKGFCVLDTHAGTGLYDLKDERALKTGEAQKGIYRLLTAAPISELAEYFRILNELNPGFQADQPETFRFYPGSPMIARLMLRPQDRLVLCELHEEEIRELRRQFRNNGQTHIHHRDGYEALGAFLPPAEKRGMALIDPPFEETNEFLKLVEAAAKTHARWREGMIMIWYPIKERPAIWRFHEGLIATGIPEMLCAEFIYEEEIRADRLNGCGLIIINPAWQLDKKLKQLFPALHEALGTAYHGTVVKWLSDNP